MPQITLLKKAFQEQGNGIHKFVPDNYDRNQDQNIPADHGDQKIPDFSKRIRIRKRRSGKHEVSVYHEKERHTDATQIINSIIDHPDAVQSHHTKTGKAFDQIQITVACFHLCCPHPKKNQKIHLIL